MLRQQRSERRWRVFFRLAWLGLVAAVLWLSFFQHGSAPAHSTPHTALVEVRGEIAVDSEASAERLVGAIKSAFDPAWLLNPSKVFPLRDAA